MSKTTELLHNAIGVNRKLALMKKMILGLFVLVFVLGTGFKKESGSDIFTPNPDVYPHVTGLCYCGLTWRCHPGNTPPPDQNPPPKD